MNFFSNIHFFDARSLADKLIGGEIDHFTATKHLAIWIGISGIGIGLPFPSQYPDYQLNGMNAIRDVIGYVIFPLIISYVGITSAYKVNSKGDDKDFLLRYAALSLPVGVRLSLTFAILFLFISIIAFALIYIYGYMFPFSMDETYSSVYFIYVIMFFTKMHAMIAYASKGNE